MCALGGGPADRNDKPKEHSHICTAAELQWESPHVCMCAPDTVRLDKTIHPIIIMLLVKIIFYLFQVLVISVSYVIRPF